MFNSLVISKKLAVIPKPKDSIPFEMIQGTYKDQLEAHLSSLSGQTESSLRIGMTLSIDSAKVLQKYFATIILEKLQEIKTKWSTTDLASSVFVSQKEAYQKELVKSVLESEGFNILQPLAEDQFDEVVEALIYNPESLFSLAFESAGLKLQLKELRKALEGDACRRREEAYFRCD